MNAREAARQLDVTQYAVKQWIANGRMKATRGATLPNGARPFVIDEDEVDRLRRQRAAKLLIKIHRLGFLPYAYDLEDKKGKVIVLDIDQAGNNHD